MDKVLNARLEKIEARVKNATPGPWESFREGQNHEDDSFIRTGGKNLYVTGGGEHDQEFIAHARQDIPFLLEQLEDFVESNAPRLAQSAKAAAKPEPINKTQPFLLGLVMGVVVSLLVGGAAYFLVGQAAIRGPEPVSLNSNKTAPVADPQSGPNDFPLTADPANPAKSQ